MGDTIAKSIFREGKAEGLTEGKAQGLTEGETIGSVKTARSILSRLGNKRFGVPTSEQRQTLENINDRALLERMSEATVDVSSWTELLAVQ